ncbi:MAG: hypothetical protein IT288_03900 [Bdellovibrionales bacterium]|nr:hypothetical protein [Bdellovibrionales bacterium]
MILYAGLSLDQRQFRKTKMKISLKPPIRRGEIYRDFNRGERIFLIADGEFDQSLAVTAGEILDILRAGGLVFGSSSIGALRAAELHEFGMIGVGEIYRLIRRTEVFQDDWLGHLFDRDTLDLITLPFIEILFVISLFSETDIEEIGNSILRIKPFRYDSITPKVASLLIEHATISSDDKKIAQKFVQQLFEKSRLSQKARDANQMLLAVGKHLNHVRSINHKLRSLDL